MPHRFSTADLEELASVRYLIFLLYWRLSRRYRSSAVKDMAYLSMQEPLYEEACREGQIEDYLIAAQGFALCTRESRGLTAAGRMRQDAATELTSSSARRIWEEHYDVADKEFTACEMRTFAYLVGEADMSSFISMVTVGPNARSYGLLSFPRQMYDKGFGNILTEHELRRHRAARRGEIGREHLIHRERLAAYQKSKAHDRIHHASFKYVYSLLKRTKQTPGTLLEDRVLGDR